MKALFSFQLIPLVLALLSESFLSYTSIGVILLTLLAFSFSFYFLFKLARNQGPVHVYAIVYYWLSTVVGVVYLLDPMWIENFKLAVAGVGLLVSLTPYLLRLSLINRSSSDKEISIKGAYKEFTWFCICFLILLQF
jgi:hypothetical protein